MPEPHRSAMTLRLLIEQLPALIWTTDDTLHITSVIGADRIQLERPPAGYIGHPLSALLGEEAASLSNLPAHLRALAGEPARYERVIAGRVFDVRVQPLRDSRQHILGCIGIALDITERKSNELLIEREQLRREFLLSISHDLRTPLTSARAALGLLETSCGARLGAEGERLLTNARRSLERLRLLIDDLIAANQITADKAFVQRTLLDLRTAVTAAAVPLQALIKGKGQLLELDLPVFLPATGDPAALEQVVINLLANAHYHTPPGTQISVAGWCDDDQIHLIVQDDGPGIPADAARVLFEPFHRLGAEAVGSGLGLATARNIIELHSGKLWLEEGTGQGKLFHIALPKTTDTWQNLARV